MTKPTKKRTNRHRIYWHKRLRLWMVNISFEGQNIHIGYYKLIENAVIARNEALAKLGKPSRMRRPSKYERICAEKSVNTLSPEDKKLLTVAKEKEKGLLENIIP